MKKALSLFLAAISFAFTLYGWQGSLNGTQVEHVYPSAIEEKGGTQVHFSAKNQSESFNQNTDDPRQIIKSALNQLPIEHVNQLKNLVIDYNPKAHRGFGGKNVMIIRGVAMSQQELIGVLIHEMGHLVDLGLMKERDQSVKSNFMDFDVPVFESDPSLDFYRISWKNEHERKRNATNEDFVSGYSMSNPFEEFAETYVYYVLHQKEFLAQARRSSVLAKKYKYMKDIVFKGEIFETGNVRAITKNQPWDITVLAYDTNTFLTE
ncbi:putative zinc-binding metallopeptidase [Candidatus Peregrinibacteria bacterium]|nr:MAG: putative zinc-binding metallopeptidase [Candidatus Peregrinibacteria bacterium]